MNTKGIVALKDTKVCMKCLKKKATRKYAIYGRGYGSGFDNFNTHFQLCDDCQSDEYSEWVNERSKTGYCETQDYKYEKQINEFIKSLPLESQELFYNRFAYGACADYNMKAQDWIDFKLGELPHKKCKQYGFYSPQEIAAYKERFPNCAKVYIKEYKDGSKGSYCPRNAYGNGEGMCDVNISNECYMCSMYEPREGDIRVINQVNKYYKNEKDRLIHMLQYASTRLRELENSVEDYMDKHK